MPKCQIYELRMPDGAKDPSELFMRDPASFGDKIRAAMAAAVAANEPPPPAYRVLSEMVGTLQPIGQRMSTGFATLDDATRGGVPLGRVVVLAGAPGAAKTTLSVHFADQWERAGCAVVYLASDEPVEGIITRLGQLGGFSRDGLESEGSAGDAIRAGFAQRSAGRRLAVIDPDEDPTMCTIEDAERAVLHLAGDRPRVLVVDSLQTARCAAADAAESLRERIDAKLAVIKAIAKRGTLVIAISEMSRAGYRSASRSENISALAAGKESGAIEYGASLLLGLRSVAGEHGQVDVEVAKNRLGGAKPELRLKLDPERASFAEVALPSGEDPSEPKADVRLERAKEHVRNTVRMHSNLASVRSVLALCDGSRSANHDAIKDMQRCGELVIVDGSFRLNQPADSDPVPGVPERS